MTAHEQLLATTSEEHEAGLAALKQTAAAEAAAAAAAAAEHLQLHQTQSSAELEEAKQSHTEIVERMTKATAAAAKEAMKSDVAARSQHAAILQVRRGSTRQRHPPPLQPAPPEPLIIIG